MRLGSSPAYHQHLSRKPRWERSDACASCRKEPRDRFPPRTRLDFTRMCELRDSDSKSTFNTECGASALRSGVEKLKPLVEPLGRRHGMAEAWNFQAEHA